MLYGSFCKGTGCTFLPPAKKKKKRDKQRTPFFFLSFLFPLLRHNPIDTEIDKRAKARWEELEAVGEEKSCNTEHKRNWTVVQNIFCSQR